jgi:hypothetical protein
MAHWERLQSHPGSFCYQRPLGINEQGFFWDSYFRGTADALCHVTVHAPQPQLFTHQNVCRSWIALKHRHPLLAAAAKLRNDQPAFVLSQDRLTSCAPGEIDFLTSDGDFDAFIHTLQSGKRALSEDVLARLWILQVPGAPSTVHLVFLCGTVSRLSTLHSAPLHPD